MKIEVPRIWVHGLGWGVHTCKKAGRILWWQTGSRVPKATLEFRIRTRVTQGVVLFMVMVYNRERTQIKVSKELRSSGRSPERPGTSFRLSSSSGVLC